MAGRIPDAKVKSATGHDWDHWTSVLDDFRKNGYNHTAAAKHLNVDHGVSAWYSQAITIQYEHDHGLRAKRQKTSGEFECTVSRTINATHEACWQAWADPEEWSAWMNTRQTHDFRVGGEYSNSDGDISVFTIIEPMTRIRFTWAHPRHSPGSHVTIEFRPVDPNRTQIGLVHGNLANTEEADELASAWRQMMDQYRNHLEEDR
jgi:uncharacterized protein YndB with AHSA1/START domain